jgi:hypothetical protein
MKTTELSIGIIKGIVSLFLLLIILFPSCSSDKDEVGPDCDLDNVTYSGTVAPIMVASCNGCHSGAAPSAGINTANHSGLSVIALNGSLMGSINHESGFSNMPKGQPQLSACKRQQIAAWVNAGVPNN